MLSKNDFEGYLKEVERIESLMEEIYSECSLRVDDPVLKSKLNALAGAESVHGTMVKGLIGLVNGFSS